MEIHHDKTELRLHNVNRKLIAAIKKLKYEIENRMARERQLLKSSMPCAKEIVSAIVFRDKKGIVHTVLKVKSRVSAQFLARCLNDQSMWELESLANPSENGLCRALVNMKRDSNCAWQDISNINDFETVVGTA